MRRGCSTEVSRRGVLDSGFQVADWAQAEQGRGRAERCSYLGGFSLGGNVPEILTRRAVASSLRTRSALTSIPL